MAQHYDRIIIGAGLYGLYAALRSARRFPAMRVLVLERDAAPFSRATYVNQARVHNGYHYPRSLSTAEKSARYFRRFVEDYGFCIHTEFRQVYATSSRFSWTDAAQFRRFCRSAGIRCDEVDPEAYFNADACDGAFLTEEYTYDAALLRDFFLRELAACPRVELRTGTTLQDVRQEGSRFVLATADGGRYETGFLLNATYAAANQLNLLLGFPPFKIKYELCEIILCRVEEPLSGVGLTVMDGPFFSIMPFGKTGFHSLTSVTFTPHASCHGDLPEFACQRRREDGQCSPQSLANCNGCPARPQSAWQYMAALARKYLRPEYGFAYRQSLFSMKPILRAAELDDSRPTVVRTFRTDPAYIAVLSGKINTVYDLDEVLDHD